MSGMGYTGGRRKARFSRANARSSYTMTLTHDPTGVAVQGSIPEGMYTRQEMRTLQATLYQRLYAELEQAVARAMRARQ